MVASSLRTRAVGYAVLFGPPRTISRQDAMNVHGRVCERLAHDDIEFKYTPAEPTPRDDLVRGFVVHMRRREGRGGFRIELGSTGVNAPLKLFVQSEWPASPQHVVEVADHVQAATFEALDGEWQRVYAEVTIRAEANAQHGNAVKDIQSTLLRFPKDEKVLGGSLVFAAVAIEIHPSGNSADPLANPQRRFRVEVLREDRRSLFLELTSQWAQMSVGVGEIDLTSVRPIDRKPSEYIEEATAYLQRLAQSLQTVEEKS